MEIEMSWTKVFWKLLMISWPNLLELKQSPNRKKSASMHSIISDCLTLWPLTGVSKPVTPSRENKLGSALVGAMQADASTGGDLYSCQW